MLIGTLEADLFISDANSLKDKRTVLKSLKDRIRNNFNVSVAEVDGEDKWQSSTLAVAAVGIDTAYVNGTLNKVMDLIKNDRGVVVTDFHIDIL
jgi:uncharacterized protein YlxP (DUF503 family)